MLGNSNFWFVYLFLPTTTLI